MDMDAQQVRGGEDTQRWGEREGGERDMTVRKRPRGRHRERERERERRKREIHKLMRERE